MALTVLDVVETWDSGNDFRAVVAEVTFDSSYATGGEALSANDLQLATGSIKFVTAHHKAGGYVPSFDYANSKMMVFQQSAATSALTEVPGATNLSAVVIRVFAVGRPIR